MTAWNSLSDGVANLVLALKLREVRALQGARLVRLSRDPMRAQRALLARIIAANKDTTFGRRHGFAGIESYERYAERVPVSTFEDLRSYVDAEIDQGESALTSEKPLCYVRTSGTTGRPKDLPLTASHLKALRRIQEIAIAFQYRGCPEAFRGGMLAIVSPAVEGLLGNGRTFGSASGVVEHSTPRAVRSKFVVPSVVLAIKETQLKYLLIMRLALARADLTYIATANPTTVLNLMRIYRQHETELIEDIRNGGFFLASSLSPEIAAAVGSRLKADPRRADELSRSIGDRSGIRIADLWPRLAFVGTWTFGSSSIAVDALRRELPPGAQVVDIGYMASEFRGTITLGRRSATGIPTLDTHFFEFVERERWDNNAPEFLTLDRVRKGLDYYVVVTTPSGLYRYFINDLVRIAGRFHRTPLLRFVQKGKGVTSITGEKLYESQVLAAVRNALERFGIAPQFVMMLADERECRYRLYVESGKVARPDARTLAAEVDDELAALNIEYQAKRQSGRLGEVTAYWLSDNAGEAFKTHCVKQGQREGQFKTVALAYGKDFSFDLGRFIDATEQ